MTTAALGGLAVGAAAGSIPFAWLLHRMATGRDLRTEGSGNPGATNLERSDGLVWGAAALALDAGKGATAVLIARRLAGDAACAPAALGAVLGHVFSPWLMGRGGKGVATAAGAFAVLAPPATAAALAVFALALAVTRFVSLGSVLGAAALPVAVSILGPDGRSAVVAAAIALLIAWRHRGNFARMRAGTEPRLRRQQPGGGGASR
jgi:acyl phosphate:glycerol-3-phosphate acyltransferase